MGSSTKLFSKPLHVGCPNLGDRAQLLAKFADILDRRWLTNDGIYVQTLEQQIADYLGVKHCIAVCNGTVGLQLAIRALGLHNEVIVPSFTFPATVHALAWEGVRPVFCDVDPTTHNIAPHEVERHITPRTTAIMGVHLWGSPCDIESLSAIARRRRLKLLFDAAHAFGCSHQQQMIGGFGDAEVFSFHATKFVNAGEGGAITTNDDELAADIRRIRNFGIENGQVSGLGINGKMNEFSAAIGLSTFEERDYFIARNRANLAAYEHVLADVPGLTLRVEKTAEQRNHQYVVVEVDPAVTGLSRDQVLMALHAENVLAKRYFFPGCHRLEPYISLSAGQRHVLPHTERLCTRLLQLPTGTTVTPDDIELIGRFLQRLSSRARVAA